MFQPENQLPGDTIIGEGGTGIVIDRRLVQTAAAAFPRAGLFIGEGLTATDAPGRLKYPQIVPAITAEQPLCLDIAAATGTAWRQQQVDRPHHLLA